MIVLACSSASESIAAAFMVVAFLALIGWVLR